MIVGLLGELTVLRHLVVANSSNAFSTMRTLDYWQGWQEEGGGRDFRIGRHSIEVKTTRASSSIHKFSGLHQVEPVLLPSGEMEQLNLMSIGLSASTSLGETLPQIINDILSSFTRSNAAEEVSDEFLRRVSLYGQSGRGYVHAAMQDWSVYGVRFAHTFQPRLYRVEDPALHLLTRDILSDTFVQADDLSFTMHIPQQVSAFNPAPSWEDELGNMQGE